MEQTIEIPNDEKTDDYSDDDLFKISSWGADLSFRELISRYDDNELVKPELQRNYVWDKPEASRFIDSILLGLPVPSVFLAKTKDEKLLIIDGYQRINTVRDYVKGTFSKDQSQFKLSKVDKIHERWRGKSFLELSEDEQRKIRNTTIHAIVFMQQHPVIGDTSLFQVFERINSSGRTLLPQEIRNCVYQGPINSLLIELNDNTNWRELWGTSTPDNRMRDLECILRFFALYKLLGDKAKGEASTRISLKKYLNQYMESVNNEKDMPELRERFIKSISFAREILGSTAFNNISQLDDKNFSASFSPTLFDAVMLSIAKYLENHGVIIDNNSRTNKKRQLLLNEGYQKLLTHETMRVDNIYKRVSEMYYALFDEEFLL